MQTDATDPAILAEQVAYYRKRAGEYDEWWFRTGRYDHGPELNAAWNADVSEVEQALCRVLDARRPQRALELACGTGLFTRWLAPRVRTLLALDASPEVQAINRDRVGADNVDYEIVDLFAWHPAERYDFVFMSFWLSHVPDDRFDQFWKKVRSALADGGCAYVIDSGWDMTSTAKNHVRPDREAGIAQRKLNDGSEYRIVKIFHDPQALAQRLALPHTFVTFDAAGKVFAALAENAWDMAFLAIDPKRATEIDFTPPYVIIEGSYMVPVDSPLRVIDDVDRPGVRIAVGQGSAYELYLSRTIEHAQIVKAPTGNEAIAMFERDRLEAAAGVKSPLLRYVSSRPDLRVMDGRFMLIEQAIGTPKGRALANAYLRATIEELKASGFVAEGLARSGQRDALVAPAA